MKVPVIAPHRRICLNSLYGRALGATVILKSERRDLLIEESQPTKSSSPNIFVCIGRPLSDTQLQFKLALLQAIRAHGFEPRTVGSNSEDTDVPSGRPIEQIRSLVGTCDGAVVVAYERHFASKLVTNSPAPSPGELSDVRFSTAWNQAEAAMAYFADLPIFLICQNNIHGECILEEGTVGAIEQIAVGREAVFADVFQRRMSNWAERVREHKAGASKRKFNASPDEMSIRDVISFFGSMSWRAAIIVGGLLFTLLSLAYSLGYQHVLRA